MATELKLYFGNIGDQVAVSAIPEAYFARHGERLFYTSEVIWVFKHNPFIDLKEAEPGDEQIVVVPDSRFVEDGDKYVNRFNTQVFGSQNEFMLNNIDLGVPKTRHPRLYVHEDLDIVPHKVVVHTTGSDRTVTGEYPFRSPLGEDEVRIMSDEVLAAISRNYKDWMIVQVGAASDKPVIGRNVIDLRGKCDLWQTAAEIASASRFIGVNSGPMHIANCYPRVSKRIVLMEFGKAYLTGGTEWQFALRPGDIRNQLTSWLDPANMYFSRFEEDCGVASSYLKI